MIRYPSWPALLALWLALTGFVGETIGEARSGISANSPAAVESVIPRRASQLAGRGMRITHASGVTPQGAHWAAQVPEIWNGTLLLWSRGYSQLPGEPELAPEPWKADLLRRGYALAASNYGAGGWAVAEAIPAQRATLVAFSRIYGRPRRTIAWGQSMGGLVSTALAEQSRPAISGAIAMCPSIGGALGMMNMGLDGAFAFKTLVAPEAGIELVSVVDDMANARKVQAALAHAMQNPAGRARLALAGILGGVPSWTRRTHPRPTSEDHDTQLDEIAASFAVGVFMPRNDQERRAGGVFSWNTGIDYKIQLDRSGRRPIVEALYRKSGLDLDADLAELNAAPRVTADPAAVAYMRAHYTPNARPRVPLVSLQAIGDGATSPSLQQAYLDVADPHMVRGLWLYAAGHCGFTIDAAVVALQTLEHRIKRGAWGGMAAGTIEHMPAPMLRPCLRAGRCE